MSVQREPPAPVAARRRCFVAAAAGADFSIVQQVLEDAGWEAFLITDVPRREASFESLARQAVSSADLVIGLLSGGARDQVVLFELGIASAFGKPIIIAASPDIVVPEQLRSLPFVWLASGSGETLELALRHASSPRGEPALHAVTRERPLGFDADRILTELKGARSEQTLIRALREALEAAGETVVQEGRAGRGIFDLGVWSPELDVTVGNPFLIEVKARIQHPADLEKHIEQVLRYLTAMNGRWAMVVYGDGREASDWPSDLLKSPVLISRADELIARMRDDSFPEVVRKLRTARAHSLQIA